MVANLQNLKHVRSTEEARKLGKQGGIKSGKVRRLKKSFKLLAQEVLNLDVSEKLADGKIKKFVTEIFPEISEKEVSNRLAVVATLMREALKGNIKAIEVLRDTAGEKPVEKFEQTGDMNVKMQKLSDAELEARIKKAEAKVNNEQEG